MDFFPSDPLILDHLQFHVDQVITLVLDIVIAKKQFESDRTPSCSRYTEFYNKWRNSRSPYYSSFRIKRYRFFSRSNSRNRLYFRNDNFSCWPPSKPRSRSASASRRFYSNIESGSSEKHDHNSGNISTSRDKLEVNMYTTEMANAKTPITRCYSLYFFFSKVNWFKYTFKTGNRFLLDSSGSFFVLKFPNCLMITRMFNLCTHDQHNTSKTLIIANRSEIPIEQNISVTCFWWI